MNKKGILPLIPFLTVGFVIALAVLFLVFFGGISVFAWILSKSIFSIVGAAILIIASLSIWKGITVPVYVWVIGAVLVMLPFVSNTIGNMSLAVLVG